MLRLRPTLWPTLIMLPIFLFSLGLGVWQMERREWKRDILDRIATNQAAAPLTLDELLKGDPLRHEYGRVRIAGSFLHDKEFYLAARSLKDKVGMQVVTPIRTDDGPIVLFDRGWIPSGEEGPGAVAPRASLPARSSSPASCGATRNSASSRPTTTRRATVWFHVDVPLMRRMAGGTPDPKLDSFFLEADATRQPRRRADRRPDPARYPQRPPAVRHHLVPDRRGAGAASISPITGRTAGSPSPAARRSRHDRQRSLRRAGAPLRHA